jgi:hypothetical protein
VIVFAVVSMELSGTVTSWSYWPVGQSVQRAAAELTKFWLESLVYVPAGQAEHADVC